MSKDQQGSAWPPQGQKVPRSPPSVPSRDTSADSLKSLGAIGKNNPVFPDGADSGSGQVPPAGEGKKKSLPKAVGDDFEEMEMQAKLAHLRKARGILLRSFNYKISACKKIRDDLQKGIMVPTEATKQIALNAYTLAEIKLKELETIQHEVILAQMDDDGYNTELAWMDGCNQELERIYAAFANYCFMGQQQQLVASNQANPENNPNNSNQALLQSMSINFKPRDHVVTFSGKDIRLYPHFKEQWIYVELQLLSFGRTKYQLLQNLYSVLSGEALGLVANLPVKPESYDLALKALEHQYNNNQKAYSLVMDELLNLQQMPHGPKAAEFNQKVVQICNSIESLDLQQEWGLCTLLHLIGSKLNDSAKKDWENTLWKKASKDDAKGHTATLQDLKDCISKQVIQDERKRYDLHARNALLPAPRGRAGQYHAQPTRQDTTLPGSFMVKQGATRATPGSFSMKGQQQTRATPVCHICGQKETHWGTRCPTLRGMKPDMIVLLIDRLKLCRMCFHNTHDTNNCPRNWSCNKCTKRHHPLLHVDNRSIQDRALPRTYTLQNAVYQMVHNSEALLQVVQGHVGNTVVNILLDSGSNINIISKRVAEHLNLPRENVPFNVNTIGGSNFSDQTGQKVSFVLHNKEHDWSIKVDAFAIDNIASTTQFSQFSQQHFPHLDGVKMSMDLHPSSSSIIIDLLIGEPLYSQIVTGPQIRGTDEEQPVAWGSRLGYFLGGKYSWAYFG